MTVITIDRPERMNAVGPPTARELSTPGRASATTTARSSPSSPAPATRRSAPAATSRRRSPATSSCRSRRGAGGARARRAARDPRADALDRPLQADDRRRQRRRLRGRAGMGLLDRPLHRRRARDVRRHLPALEHRPRRRRHAAAAADRRLPRGDGADPHRPRDRRARGAAHRAGQRGRAARHLRARGRASWRTRSRRCPSRRSAPTRRPPPRGFGRPLDEGLRIEAECFNRLIDGAEMAEGLRRFNERDHPDRARRAAAHAGARAASGVEHDLADGRPVGLAPGAPRAASASGKVGSERLSGGRGRRGQGHGISSRRPPGRRRQAKARERRGR